MASSSKDGEKMKGVKGDEDKTAKAPESKKLQHQTSALGAMAQGLAGMAVATAKTTEEDDHLESAMGKIFHPKTSDYASLGGGPRSGTAAQVDSGAKFYKATNPEGSRAKIATKAKETQDVKVKQKVPEIGALGAFTAMVGGLTGGVTMAMSEKIEEDVNKDTKTAEVSLQENKNKDRKTSFMVGTFSDDDVDVEIDEARKFSSQYSNISADQDEDPNDISATVDVRTYGKRESAYHWDSDEDRHSQALYPHIHHVMPRIRRKKKTSISRDEEENDMGPDIESDTRKKSSGHKRHKKISAGETLPSIPDEDKVEFGIGTTADEESEREIRTTSDTFERRSKRLVSESSYHTDGGSETEDGHNKFATLKIDGDTSKISKTHSGTSKTGKHVMFSVGHDEESEMDDQKGDNKMHLTEEIKDGEEPTKKKKRRSGHTRATARDLRLRTRIGSMVKMEAYDEMIEGDEELEDLKNRDINEMAAHRMDRMGAVARHKISRDPSKHDLIRVSRKKRHKEGFSIEDGGVSTDAEHHFVAKMYGIDPSAAKEFNKTPHDIFVQMSELSDGNNFWEERSRWIKYEECKEQGAERWGRPHLSSLSFHSLINLRLCLEKAIIILDYDQARDFTNIAYKLVEEGANEGHIPDEQLKSELLRLLLLRHKFVEQHAPGEGRASEKIAALKRTMSRASMANLMHHNEPLNRASTTTELTSQEKDGMTNGLKWDQMGGKKDPNHLVINMGDGSGGMPSASTFVNLYQVGQTVHKTGIMHRLKPDTEGTIVLVGTWEYINEPLCAFMRLGEGIILPNTMEVPIPVRFLFLLLTPTTGQALSTIDPHEVGRSFSTMMSNPEFHNQVYQFSARKQLLTAINEFLDASVVLPSGDWDSKNLISISEIKDLRKHKQAMKDTAEELKGVDKPQTDNEELPKKDGEGEDDYDPLMRGRYPFSGVVNDLKRRFPWYLSDFVDALNGQCVAATIFIYFAALSGAVAFGGLTGDATEDQIGIPETLITSSVTGVLFALFAGQPLIITGLTGPILLYDQSLFNFSKDMEVDFLQWRVWIGIWLFAISLVVAACQGSVLVRYFSKFTKDIFASLVSLLFIFSALMKLAGVFTDHPLVSKIGIFFDYCKSTDMSNLLANESQSSGISNDMGNIITATNTTASTLLQDYYNTTTCVITLNNETVVSLNNETVVNETEKTNEPNTALLSFILMFGTFIIAYGLKLFRNSKYMGRTVRRALGDFGVPIAIVLMVLIDYLAGDTYTKKLSIEQGLQTTIPTRGWLINPMVSNLTILAKNGTMIPGPRQIPIWLPFVSIIPAFLLFLVLFIETEICELLMLEKSKKKGGGLHWDIVLLCFLNACASIFGGPWICAATVRGVAHVSALTVMSTNHAPGEAPHIVEVKDQRVTALTVSLLVGFSVLLAAALQQVPFAVLYGVFLYMGISGINGIQMFDRLAYAFMPVKHHPRVGYTRRVRTWKMHLFTGCQFGGLAILWTVKSIPAIALAFPFFVVGMIGIRWSMKFFFTQKELEHLDGPSAGKAINDEDGDPDFYEEGIGG